MLSQAQREHYFENGFVYVEGLIAVEWLDRLQQQMQHYLEESRTQTRSGDFFDLALGHSAHTPRVRRLTEPDRDPIFWEYANDKIADVAADLLGPDVTFHHAKLNFKWPTTDGSNRVGWHQDIAFYPHTNYNVLAIGTYLQDTGPEQGPLSVIPGSHRGRIYEHYDKARNWIGELESSDAQRIDERQAVSFPGPRGSITVHHARTLHGSRPSHGSSMRPLLINTYVAADAFPYTDGGVLGSENYRKLVRGQAARRAQHDPRPCPLPPNWSAGYPSLYEQQSETGEA